MANTIGMSSALSRLFVGSPNRTARDYLALAAQRRALRKLDGTALKDLGLTREEALAEAARPIWDVPANWRR